MRGNIKAVCASALAIALGLGGALVVAMPATAATGDANTPGWIWETVDDVTTGIDDAQSFYFNYAGTGVDLQGWSSDAFDGFPNTFEMTFAATTISPTFTTVSSDYDNAGVTTIVTSATADFGSGNTIDVTRTLEIQGSYARWSYAFVDGGNSILAATNVHVEGNLGSDGATTYAAVGTNGLVSSDGGDGDPIVGYDFSTGSAWSYDVTDTDDQFKVDFAADSTSTLTLGLMDWDPCSYTAAVSAMTALVPNLAANFGGTIAQTFTTNCLQVAAPAAVTGGVATDQSLGLSESPALATWNYYDDSGSSDYLRMAPVTLPAGLAATLVFDGTTGAPSVHLTGTVTPGAHTVTLLFYEEFDPGLFDVPTLASFTITASGLAATGVEVTPWLISAALLSLLGVALVAGASARRRFGQRA